MPARYLKLLVIFFVIISGFGARADEACKTCHVDQYENWLKSHHAKSMMPANSDVVLGDFKNVSISHHGQKILFSNQDGLQVTITDKDGNAQTYTIEYTFGVTPLQQYLVKTTGGKYQVLPFAWDTRPKDKGGQLWFHIYPDEYLPKWDRLHWKGPMQNWNGMCADCHSTGLKRQYDNQKDEFKTSFKTVNVSCASCHVGADYHAKAQKQGNGQVGLQDDLLSYLKEKDGFVLKDGAHTATWSGKTPRERPEMNVCAACHSLRSPLTDGIDPSRKFLNQFAPSLLDEGLYFADGQIKEEVYVWGSFLQSKMYKKGVSCFDCHDSHSLRLKAEGNALCAQCHSPPVFDTPNHHKHPVGSTGAQCVNCHMPERTYMVVDPRRDHSFKIPRPDISAITGSPNACVSCHTGQTNDWAQKALSDWYPNSFHRSDHAITIFEARRGNPTVRKKLQKYILNENISVIQRATALSLVPNIANSDLLSVAASHLGHPDPLMRIGAVRALNAISVDQRVQLIAPLLKDPVKAVRIETARSLLFSKHINLMDTAFQELLAVDSGGSWRGEGRVNAANFATRQNDISKAEQEYRASIKSDPVFAPAILNLSEILRQTGREDEANKMLKDASERENADPAIYHAYGLSLIRGGNRALALSMLAKAADNAPDIARYSYVYIVALNSMGKQGLAYDKVKQALKLHPYNRDLLTLARSLAYARRDTDFMREIETTLAKF